MGFFPALLSLCLIFIWLIRLILKVCGKSALSHSLLAIIPRSGWYLHVRAKETEVQSGKGFN